MKRTIRTLLISLTVLVVLVAAVASAGLWNGSGNLFDFIAGQFQSAPTDLDAGISLSGSNGAAYAVDVTVDASHAIGSVSPNYLSFSIDASQVTGGKWWNPTAAATETGSGTVRAPPYDFSRPRLDLLARALAPAYLRIGGSESDKIYYDLESGEAAPPSPPPGYQSVLTRRQWDALNAFATRNNLNVVFTLNAGPGTRRNGPDWNGANAQALIEYTARQRYPVTTWELGNELNIFWFVHGLRAQVTTSTYHKDLQSAKALVRQYMPQTTLGGEGSAIWPVLGEPLSLFYGFLPGYLKRSGALIDQLSWHYYPQQSRRGPIASRRASPSRMLNPKNLDEAGLWADRMRAWRDAYAPGKPIWLGETGNAQFGGEPGLSDVYLSGLWWLDELGLLATKATQVVVRQTLSGLDYGMIDDATLDPRPDFWNSLLWKQLMGTQVYAMKVAGANGSSLRAYAQSSPGATDSSVTVLLINIDPKQNATVRIHGLGSGTARVFEITSPDVLGRAVQVNGHALTVSQDGRLPDVAGLSRTVESGSGITVHPLSYTFVQRRRQ